MADGKGNALFFRKKIEIIHKKDKFSPSSSHNFTPILQDNGHLYIFDSLKDSNKGMPHVL